VIRSSERPLAAAVIALAMTFSLPASAQRDGPLTEPKDMASRLGAQGLELHAQGKFADAYEKLVTAEKIVHSPVFVLWMARSKRALGELLAARRAYQRVVAETVAKDAPRTWIDAKADADKELALLGARIPTIAIVLPLGAPAGVKLELDGAPVAERTPSEVDPGKHLVRAIPLGRPAVEHRVSVEEGKREVVEIELPALDVVPASGRVSTDKGSALPGALSLGVGVVGIAAGAIMGGYALALAGDVKMHCTGNVCPLSYEGKAHDADTLARASTGALIAGGVIGALGVVLLIVRPGRKAPPALLTQRF
jgi:hypothetical protein